MHMIDIHSHIIPKVDDGSESMEMTLDMMLRAYDQGVRVFFATPHSRAFSGDPFRTMDAFWELKTTAKRYFPDAELYFGSEIKCDIDRMDKVKKALRRGTLPTMNNTPYILTEFSQWVLPENTVPCLEKLVRAGWKPIIAHMERYAHLRNLPELVEQFRDLGCLIQINAYSLEEETDESIKIWAQQLVLSGNAHFLGTDMHRTYHRPPSVETGLKWLYDNCTQDNADAIAFGNARKLLMKQE